MLDRFFTAPLMIERLRHGALSTAIDDVAACLYDRGYSAAVARSYLSIAGHFSHWLTLEDIAPIGLSTGTVARFREEHLPACECAGPRGMRSHVRAALGHVLAALTSRGWVAASPVPEECPVDGVLRAFDTHLADTCGAAPATRRLYTRYARGLLETRFGAGGVDLRALGPKEILGFISEQARARAPETAKAVRTALRSFLRFAQLQGLCDRTLVAAVPRVARWKRAQLPRALSDQQLAALLGSFDRSTALGRRDYAMTLCLTQMGLRAGEVATLSLDDIDWRAGTLRLAHGKERRASVLPLPVPDGGPGVDGAHGGALPGLPAPQPGEDAMSSPPLLQGSPGFPSLLQDFFCQRLIGQRNVTARTVAAYRDAFRLLLRYTESQLHRSPVAVTLADLDAPLILGFLEHLEKERGNCVRSRNLRLVAIRSFLRYAAYRDPTALPTVQRVLAIPTKRFDRPLLGFLSHPEMEAVLEAPNRSTWSGQRDHVMLTTLYNTGARVSEIVGLRVADLDPGAGSGASVRIRGKGRKERMTPLWRSTAKLLSNWLHRVSRDPGAPLFPNRHGRPLSRSGVEQRLRAALTIAEERCPSLRGRSISPHTVRHTTAMHLLQSGVDLSVIALWLGHESPATTHRYIEADLAMKERALKSLQEPPARHLRFRATDSLLSFLDGL